MEQRSRWLNLGLTVLSSSLLIFSAVGCSYADQGATALDSSPHSLSPQQVEDFEALVAADVMYLGERHDSADDHAAQLAIITALHQENPNLAIGMEMFQRPFQPVLDRYLSGEISEADLIEQSEYETRWGFPWEHYAPILRFAQTHQIPVLALNAPAEVTRKVAREGLDSLAGEDLQYIPPITDIDTSNRDYQNYVKAAFGAHGSHGNFNFDNFFAAQVVWDETMAMGIAEFRQTHPDTQVVVLAGQGHVVYGYGIPERVGRRLGEGITQQIVLLNPAPVVVEGNEGAIADILWYSE
ncbi:MAG: ChaN family lipoprotein [Cyanobacteria bacterium J06635_15]